jgi:hypothetical protein
LTSGWQLDAYRKNPVVLWAHRSGEPPIGRCVDCAIEDAPPALVQTVEFADKTTYEFADTIFSLYKGKFLNAVSVGFLPTKEPTRIVDEKGNWTGSFEFNGQELLELSCVPVPTNPQALARAVTKGFSASDLARVFEPVMSEVEVLKELIAIYGDIATLAVRVAKKALLALRAAGVVEAGGDVTLEEMLAIVKQAGTSVGEAPEPGDEITSIDELGVALGVGDEVPGDDELEIHPAGSRRWRDVGRLRLRR